jgi:hypothetical protein
VLVADRHFGLLPAICVLLVDALYTADVLDGLGLAETHCQARSLLVFSKVDEPRSDCSVAVGLVPVCGYFAYEVSELLAPFF